MYKITFKKAWKFTTLGEFFFYGKKFSFIFTMIFKNKLVNAGLEGVKLFKKITKFNHKTDLYKYIL